MSNYTQVLSRPIKLDCVFNCLNPIIYKFRREDATYSLIADNGGLRQLRFDAIDLTSYFEAGDSVYLDGYGVTEVTDSVISLGNTLVTVDVPYAGTETGHINNLDKKSDYKLEVGVYNAETDESLGPVISTDYSQDGIAFVDISGIVSAYIRANWSLPSGIAEVESETSIEVYVKYQEFYDQTYWEQITETQTIVAVFGFINMILGSVPNFTRYPYGGNLAGYLPNPPIGKWLTRFTKLSAWRGYPFTFSVIWPRTSQTLEVSQQDSTSEVLQSTSTPHTDTENRIVRWKLESLQAGTAKVVMGLFVTGIRILEDIEITIKDPCDSPVYLFWKNSLGGDSFWMFDESQDYQYTYPGGRKVKRMVLFADDLRADEWDAINELHSPSQVIAANIVDYGMDDSIDKTHFRNDNQVYIISATGEKVGVIVIAEESKSRSIQRKHSIEVTIELPEIFTV